MYDLIFDDFFLACLPAKSQDKFAFVINFPVASFRVANLVTASTESGVQTSLTEGVSDEKN